MRVQRPYNRSPNRITIRTQTNDNCICSHCVEVNERTNKRLKNKKRERKKCTQIVAKATRCVRCNRSGYRAGANARAREQRTNIVTAMQFVQCMRKYTNISLLGHWGSTFCSRYSYVCAFI